jgi:hypothetical protein
MSTFLEQKKWVEDEDGTWIEVLRRPKLKEHVASGPKSAPQQRKISNHIEHRIWRRQDENLSMSGAKTIKYSVNIYDYLPDDVDDVDVVDMKPSSSTHNTPKKTMSRYLRSPFISMNSIHPTAKIKKKKRAKPPTEPLPDEPVKKKRKPSIKATIGARDRLYRKGTVPLTVISKLVAPELKGDFDTHFHIVINMAGVCVF